ncbi:MAG: DUF115 domain-containing protein [Fibrobacteres bacterium]|nr:DUF115 domain-containing protein [Fibrobacterota bacterium]
MDYVSAIEKINSAIFGIFNMLSNANFFLNGGASLLKENEAYHNIGRGKRCFILGLGPSLSSMDLSKIRAETIFAVNNFVWAELAKSINPTYYVVVDSQYYREKSDTLKEIVSKAPNCQYFFLNKGRTFVENMDNKPAKRAYINAKLVPYGDYVKFDMRSNMTASMNVVNAAIQIALYMGFSKIYLLGCDFNQFVDPQNILHCWSRRADDDVMTITYADFLNRHAIMLRHHYALNVAAKNRNIQIVNLTPGSLIDAYERADLAAVM